MNALQLAQAARGRLVQGSPAWEIPRAVADSREVQPGDLFVAIEGERTDGHLFVGQALAAGAQGALVNRAVEPPPGPAVVEVADVRRALLSAARTMAEEYTGLVCAVTGSVGKTTTKEIWAACLGPLGDVFRNPGNYNSDIGMPLALFSLRKTHHAAVFELGMRGQGEIRRLARILKPKIGVITLIGDSHLSELGSVDAIARAKSELLSELPVGGTAVLNADDPYMSQLRLSAPPNILLVGRGADADLRIVRHESLGTSGSRLLLRYGGLECGGEVTFVGEGAVLDAALAIGGAIAAGVSFADAVAALANARPAKGRLRTYAFAGLTVIDDTYNASPQSLGVALALLRDLPASGRRIAVLGDMRELGDAEVEMHRAMGRDAAHSADLVLAIGDFSQTVAQATRDAGGQALAIADVDGIVAELRGQAHPGDVVLFKASRSVGLERAVERLREALQ
ncbi:MAG: UDP-N-acetylmuramoyl-tripeptide--D-alanyl-D-alanine ligase [Thermaerobacter sp.]|nr:UDP-N-acetylmuramoyl-tripeptide--D-alanyl-D-alanine ligase [Thermaerobacter sp.]